jgi:hypothetical protein
VRETTQRLLDRFDNGDSRPPPRGEAGFLEVAEKEGREHWWAGGIPPTPHATVRFDERPTVAPLVDLCQRNRTIGVALVSSERVRLLVYEEGALEELEDWELALTSGDWRERKSSRSRDPMRAQGVNSSGRDQHEERLDHNRRRFLTESGSLAGRRLGERGLDRVLGFGPAADSERFADGLASASARFEMGGDAELISTPAGVLAATISEAVERLAAEEERALVERALGEADGAPGATGLQETSAALGEGRVEHLLFDPAIGAPAEELVRGALAGGARVTVARDGPAELLGRAGGVAGILRY